MVKKEWIDKGFVDEPVAKELDLKSEIRELCRKKNAVIMAHYYTEGIIQDLADFVGDSLALAQKLPRPKRISSSCAVCISWERPTRFFVLTKRSWFRI